jgi:hypothetical protein
MTHFALLALVALPSLALAQPTDPHPLRVTLKSHVPGVHLIETESRKPLCSGDCTEVMEVDHVLEYELEDSKGNYVGTSIRFPVAASTAVIEFSGRRPALWVPGTILVGAGIAGVVGALVLVVLAFISPLDANLSGHGNQLLLAALFSASGALLAVPGALLMLVGLDHRQTVTSDAPQPTAEASGRD